MATRKEVADAVKASVGYLFLKYRHSVVFELGLMPWGSRRADVVANKINGALVIVEVKSCMADLRNDKKWTEYRHHCDKLYLAFTSSVWDQVKAKQVRIPPKVGVIVLCADGYARIVKRATTLPLTTENRLNMLARLAWRQGDLSKRTNRARKRVFLKE